MSSFPLPRKILGTPLYVTMKSSSLLITIHCLIIKIKKDIWHLSHIIVVKIPQRLWTSSLILSIFSPKLPWKFKYFRVFPNFSENVAILLKITIFINFLRKNLNNSPWSGSYTSSQSFPGGPRFLPEIFLRILLNCYPIFESFHIFYFSCDNLSWTQIFS